ncbi:MAG: undecaprenyl-diphosphate phosphatase, partial [Thermus sp.]
MAAPFWDALALGMLEGAAEFLPVSSTGHLILAGAVLGHEPADLVTFNIVIQLGAILAILVAYRARLVAGAAALRRRDPAAVRLSRNLAMATLPALLVGALAYEAIKALLASPETVVVSLFLGGLALLLLDRRDPARPGAPPRALAELSAGAAMAIGAVQCLALVPGVSRSGATILG